ncbi:aldo/keto reductase [Microvirga puerhi]|uniref:Aldo/keto reductase n=1 Tax=Microvirga puerhi TaxID=2876078 RepID=A0ABS7VRA7_9HYPH|nr:aldo/keto reductase [Microvirga puerhi]MBZ6078088.1 aldo/keto reductase [Microvirga puerhi]
MRNNPFGSGGPLVSAIGQGTWRLDEGDRSSAIAALRIGLDSGMTHIDTAEMYGEAEPLVKEALGNRRDEVFLVSKVLPQNASRRGTVAACERSLRRLGTDRLDCYLLHWRGNYPLEETIAAFETLRAGGKILSWGVSNFDKEDLEETASIAGPGRIACNQVLYHLEERAIEHAVIPWCERNGVAVVAYSPFGHGEFPSLRTDKGKVLARIAARHDATPRQVALAFLTHRATIFTIPKAGSPDHARENAAAGNLALSEAEFMEIDKAFPRGPRPRALPMI